MWRSTSANFILSDVTYLKIRVKVYLYGLVSIRTRIPLNLWSAFGTRVEEVVLVKGIYSARMGYSNIWYSLDPLVLLYFFPGFLLSDVKCDWHAIILYWFSLQSSLSSFISVPIWAVSIMKIFLTMTDLFTIGIGRSRCVLVRALCCWWYFENLERAKIFLLPSIAFFLVPFWRREFVDCVPYSSSEHGCHSLWSF